MNNKLKICLPLGKKKLEIPNDEQDPLPQLVGRHVTDITSSYTFLNRSSGSMILLKDQCGNTFACKILSRLFREPEDVRSEVEIMYQLDGHPNIINLVDVVNDGECVYVIMEHCRDGVDLAKMMVKRGNVLNWPSKTPRFLERYLRRMPFKEEEAREVFRQIAEVIHHCHGLGVMYRDFKPENFMFLNKKKGDLTMKLVNFRFATFFGPDLIVGIDEVGSLPYIAPEVIEAKNNLESYGPEADIWSAGVILYYLLSGELPFSSDTINGLPRAIRESGYKNFDAKPAWRNISGTARQLVSSMLEENVKKRISAAQIMDHLWIEKGRWHEANWTGFGRITDTAIIIRMRQFEKMSMFKRLSIMVIVQILPDIETNGLRTFLGSMLRGDCRNNHIRIAEGLSFQEMRVGLAKWGIDHPQMNRLLEAVDMDGNGVISQAEFIAATIHRNRYIRSDVLKQAFCGYYDKENKGFMTAKTLLPVLNQFNLPENKRNEIIAEVFTNIGMHYLPYASFELMMIRKE